MGCAASTGQSVTPTPVTVEVASACSPSSASTNFLKLFGAVEFSGVDELDELISDEARFRHNVECIANIQRITVEMYSASIKLRLQERVVRRAIIKLFAHPPPLPPPSRTKMRSPPSVSRSPRTRQQSGSGSLLSRRVLFNSYGSIPRSSPSLGYSSETSAMSDLDIRSNLSNLSPKSLPLLRCNNSWRNTDSNAIPNFPLEDPHFMTEVGSGSGWSASRSGHH